MDTQVDVRRRDDDDDADERLWRKAGRKKGENRAQEVEHAILMTDGDWDSLFLILSRNRYSRLMVPFFWWNIVLQKLKLIRVSTRAQKEEPGVRLSDMSDGK